MCKPWACFKEWSHPYRELTVMMQMRYITLHNIQPNIYMLHSLLLLIGYSGNFVQLNQAVGSMEAIAKESKEHILENTDLSADNAEVLSRFFRDPMFYLRPKIN